MTAVLQEQISYPAYEATPEGLGAAIDATVAQYLSSVTRTPSEPGDPRGLAAGEELVLYPDENDRDITIVIAPSGEGYQQKRLPAGDRMLVTYDGKGAPGSGRYLIYNNSDG